MSSETVRIYDQVVDSYDRAVTAFWDNFPIEAIESFKERTRGNPTLSLGSGSGRDALLLKSPDNPVVCLDGSINMCGLSMSRELPSVQGDFLHLPFNNSFMGVWAFTSLIFLRKEQLPTALSQIHQTLVSKGHLAVGFIEGEGQELKSPVFSPDNPIEFTYYRADEMAKLIEAAGFKIEEFYCYQPRSTLYITLIGQRMD